MSKFESVKIIPSDSQEIPASMIVGSERNGMVLLTILDTTGYACIALDPESVKELCALLQKLTFSAPTSGTATEVS